MRLSRERLAAESEATGFHVSVMDDVCGFRQLAVPACDVAATCYMNWVSSLEDASLGHQVVDGL